MVIDQNTRDNFHKGVSQAIESMRQGKRPVFVELTEKRSTDIDAEWIEWDNQILEDIEHLGIEEWERRMFGDVSPLDERLMQDIEDIKNMVEGEYEKESD